MTEDIAEDTGEVLRLRGEVKALLAAALERNHADEVEAERVLAEAVRVEGLHAAQIEHLQSALATRDLIGQAKGVVMATFHCSADDAFKLLVSQSQHENRKLVAIAAEIAARAARMGSG